MHEIFTGTTVIPVLTIEKLDDAIPLARALVKGGLRCIEVTLRTPVASEAIAAITSQVSGAIVGAGTILRPADVAMAQAVGAKFLMSPGLTPDLAAAGLASDVPFIPGVATPSEIMVARGLGISFLKFFPAEAFGGVTALRDLAPAFKGVAFCPSSGVTEGNAQDYLSLPNVPMVGGSWMALPEMIAAGDWRGISEAAFRASALKKS